MNSFGVVSVEPDRVWIEEVNGKRVVVKISSSVEVGRIGMVRKWLLKDDNSQLRWGKVTYKIRVPEIISWDRREKRLCLQYMPGENLEILLKTTFGNSRVLWVELIRAFLEWTTSHAFFWKGAAPRHIIVNRKTQEIYLVDFERPLCVFDSPLSLEEFRVLVRGPVREEFSAFLFSEEQEVVFGDIWINPQPCMVPLESITSTRQRALLRAIFGKVGSFVPVEQLVIVEKLMVQAVTPFLLKGRAFFPLILLEEVRGAENYAQTVLELSKTERAQWGKVLERRVQNNTIRPPFGA